MTQFKAALFIIARTWEQSTCPSIEEWIKKVWYIYTMEYYSGVNKMDGTGKKSFRVRIIQTQKDKHGMNALISTIRGIVQDNVLTIHSPREAI